MQRPQEKTRDIAATVKEATQSNKTTLLHSEEEDFEILCTQSLEEESAKMTEKNVKLPGAMKVKALLQREGQGVEGSSPEIRRFNVTEVTYKALVTRVRSVFNVDQEQHCCLFWKDDDEDLVQFSTTRELRHALDNMPDDTLRVHVTVTPDVTKADIEPEQENEKAGVKQDKMAKKGLANKQNNEEFNAVRQQVPETFRGWVRQYVRTWFQQGAEAANQIDTLPEGAPPHFRQWLHDFLSHWTQRHAGKASSGETGIEVGDKVEEILSAPEGLPPLYYRWICLFMPRFYQRYTKRMAAVSVDKDGGQVPQCPKGHGRLHGHGFRHGRVHHGCQGEKGGKREGQSSSSESEDSDCGEKMWKKVPKELRKYVRVSVKQLHKDKGDNLKAKEKATRDGLSPEVMEFVDQIIPEWHAKLSQKRPRDVAVEMMEGEISLPAGLEKDHFLWMCRFMARWHRRHAGKCDVISAWSSGETDDSSSGEERGEGCSRQRHFHCTVNAMPGHPSYAMHYGMPNGCHPPPPPHMIGCMTPPPPPPFFAPHRMNFTARKMGFGGMPQGQMLGFGARCYRKGHGQGQGQGCRRSMNQSVSVRLMMGRACH